MIWVTEKLGLHPLMELRQDYNIQLIHQFFATVYFGESDDGDIYWMTGNKHYKSTFRKFAAVLGYPFHDRTSGEDGYKMHAHGIEPDKNKLAPLYMPTGTPAKDLLPLYDILLRTFRCNISPSGGNNDAIRGGLVNLLYHSYEVFHNGEDEQRSQEIDVLSFIYECYLAVMDRKIPPYAPYIMKLLVAVVMDQDDLLDFSTTHHYGTLRVRTSHVVTDAQAGFGAQPGEEPVWTSTLSREIVSKKVKKLSWYQWVMLCMNVEIHKENYAQYRNNRIIIKQHDEILKNRREFANDARCRAEEPVIPSPPKSPDHQSTSTIPYDEWNNARIHWGDFADVSPTVSRKGKEPVVEDSEAEGGDEDEEPATDEEIF
jgi:hypothetical protein